jgi:transposase
MSDPFGRPSKLTPEIQEKLLSVIKLGAYRTVACDFAGITPETLRNWIRRGETDGVGPYYEFTSALKQAEASACLKALGTIRTAMEQSWQAAAWFLERKRPKEWAKRERHELTGKDGGPIRTQVRLGDLPPHERRARLDAIARRLGIEALSQSDAPRAVTETPERVEAPPDAEGASRSKPA